MCVPSHFCSLQHSSWQYQILNPLSKARDQTCILVDASQICFCWATVGTPMDENLALLFYHLFSSCSISALFLCSCICLLFYFDHFLWFLFVSCLFSRFTFCGYQDICIKHLTEVPFITQQVMNQLVSMMRMWVRSLDLAQWAKDLTLPWSVM